MDDDETDPNCEDDSDVEDQVCGSEIAEKLFKQIRQIQDDERQPRPT